MRPSPVDLRGADLSEADLSGALLFQTDLSEADLSAVRGPTNEQLERQVVASLEDATMPNGQKYEDWIEDRKGRGNDGENTSPS